MANSLVDALEIIRPNWLMYYVYIMRRPTGKPFYVGKGRRDRIAMHERNAQSGKDQTYRGRIIRDVLRSGKAIAYELVGFYDSESAAFSEERRLIALYGRFDSGGALANHTDGGEGSSNPSPQTLAKRVKKLRAVMRDPEHKAAAVAVLSMHCHSAERKRKAREATQTPQYREAASARIKKRWGDPAERSKMLTRGNAAKDLVWRARQAEGLARLRRDDPTFEERRQSAQRHPDVRARIKASMAKDECKQKRSENTRAQRAEQEQVRQRVLAIAKALSADIPMPNHRSGLETWMALETSLMAGALL